MVRPMIEEVIETKQYKKNIKKIRHKPTKERLKKQIKKILENPNSIGKPLRYSLKGESRVHIDPYCFVFTIKGKTLYLLRFMHHDEVYK